MSDQVARLSKLAPQFQLGRPPAGGIASCTDNMACAIVEAETGRRITPAMFRSRTGHADPCTGLTPAETLRGLAAFGVRKYRYVGNVTASDVLKANDRGLVLLGVGYGQYPVPRECQVGGREDMGFRGAHAVICAGRRKGDAYRLPGRWVVWMLDPDHRQGHKPTYDRFDAAYLTRAMAALVTDTPWATTFALVKGA